MRISPTESFTKGLELIEVEKNRWNKFQASFCLGGSRCVFGWVVKVSGTGQWPALRDRGSTFLFIALLRLDLQALTQ